MGDIYLQKVNSEKSRSEYLLKGPSMSMMFHVHSVPLVLFNLHKNPTAILYFPVAESGRRKSPINKKDEMTLQSSSQVYHFLVLRTSNSHESWQFSFLFLVLNVLCSKLFSGGSFWKRLWTREDCCTDKWVNSQTEITVGRKHTYRRAHYGVLHHWTPW